jgi:hypothetical protein
VPCAAAPARDQLAALAAAEPLPAAERVPSRASLSRSAQSRSAQFRRPARGPLARGTATADGSWRFRRCVRRRGSASPRLPEPASRRPLVALARHCEVGVHPRSVAAPARRDAPSCGASAARRFASIWSRCGGGAYVQAQPDPPPAGSVLRLCRASPVCPVGNSRGSIVRPQRRNELPNPLPTAITSRSEAACEQRENPALAGLSLSAGEGIRTPDTRIMIEGRQGDLGSEGGSQASGDDLSSPGSREFGARSGARKRRKRKRRKGRS